MECIYCGGKTYLLGSGQRKCKECKRKFSPRRIEKRQKLLQALYEGKSALETSKALGVSYESVKRHYFEFRRKMALFMDADFENKTAITASDEYLYLPKKTKDLTKAINILTFNYDHKIYNILMPPLYFSDEKELRRFLRTARIQTGDDFNQIREFWTFFEDRIARYKGVSKENFIYYLKEAEFFYNFGINYTILLP